jgi:hypothetical protein
MCRKCREFATMHKLPIVFNLNDLYRKIYQLRFPDFLSPLKGSNALSVADISAGLASEHCVR